MNSLVLIFFRLKKFTNNLLRGIAMGIADVVPGVSGGTIALVLGIYEQLLENISNCALSFGKILKGDFSGFTQQLKKVNFFFLIPVIAGMFVTIVSVSGPMVDLLEEHPEPMSGLFFGLVTASAFITFSLINSWNVQKIIFSLATAIIFFALLGIRSSAFENPSSWVFFISGFVAICAWILPGVSGAFLLLIMGNYASVLTAIDNQDFEKLSMLSLGATIGLAVFSTLLKFFLDKHRDIVLSCLIGLMIGSSRVLWPWPNGVGVINEDGNEMLSGTNVDWPNSNNFLTPLLLGFLAFGIVLIIDSVSKRSTKPKINNS
jgi:putative membrane protein